MTAEIKSLARPATSTRLQDTRLVLLRYADVLWTIALALFAALYSLQYDILRQPLPYDTTYHIYAAQQMLIGHAIYRDVGIIKAPLSDFASAFAVMVARAIHISDIMGTRLMSLSVAMATVGAVYLAGKALFRARAAGVLAGIVMATWNFYGLRAVTGPEPKAFVILFALLAMVCIAQKRWGWAGVCAGLSTLSWQPALMMQAIAMFLAFVAPWLEPNRENARQMVQAGLKGSGKVLLGFAAPLAVVGFYLVVNSALTAALNATIGANLFHFRYNQAVTPLFETVSQNWKEIVYNGVTYCFFSKREQLLVGLGALGFLGMIAVQIVTRLRAKRWTLDMSIAPLALYGLGFAAFTLIDFDYCPDLVPLMPVVALSVGWLGLLVARGVAALVARWDGGQPTATRLSPQRAQLVTLIVLGIALAALYGSDALGYRITSTTFLDQLDAVHTAETYLAPQDRVLSFGSAIVLIELRKDNASKILHLGSKSGLGILASEPGGVQGMIAALDADPPKLVTLARQNRQPWMDPFYTWLDQRYDQVTYNGRANMSIYVLKQ